MSTKSKTKDKKVKAKKIQTQKADNSSKLFVGAIMGVMVIGIAAVAYLATQNSGPTERTTPDGEVITATADIEIDGDPLPPLEQDGTDPLTGTDTKAPTLVGTDLNGEALEIAPNGTPKAIYFLAHWCPHCQAEVPQVQALIDDDKKPENLEIVAVSTSVDETRGNFPPSAWLDREGFTPLTMRDNDASEALTAFGGTSFPFVVYLNGENEVILRTSGAVDADRTAQLWEAAAQS